MSRALPVYERFHAWQGEGAHMGKSAFFIRLHGCPVHCPWCDSAGTWHPDHVPDSIDRIEPIDLAEEALQSGCEIVVITGGEPGPFFLAPAGLQPDAAKSVFHPRVSAMIVEHGTYDFRPGTLPEFFRLSCRQRFRPPWLHPDIVTMFFDN